MDIRADKSLKFYELLPLRFNSSRNILAHFNKLSISQSTLEKDTTNIAYGIRVLRPEETLKLTRSTITLVLSVGNPIQNYQKPKVKILEFFVIRIFKPGSSVGSMRAGSIICSFSLFKLTLSFIISEKMPPYEGGLLHHTI